MQTLPETFRPLLWSYDFDRMDAVKHRKTLIVQAINYGSWRHWSWLIQNYGRRGVRQVLTTIPVTEIKPHVRRLAALIFGVTEFNCLPRGSRPPDQQKRG